MTQYNWSKVPREQLSPTVARQVIHAERIAIARLFLTKGAIVPRHSHENEQITMLESGKLRFVFDDEERILNPGDALQIPSNAAHLVETLEDSVATDLFAPTRQDWISGDDAYLRR